MMIPEPGYHAASVECVIDRRRLVLRLEYQTETVGDMRDPFGRMRAGGRVYVGYFQMLKLFQGVTSDQVSV